MSTGKPFVEPDSLAADDELTENAKLRELVKHMITHIEFTSEEDGEPMCWRCPYGKSESSCDFEQRVTALGIEVNT